LAGIVIGLAANFLLEKIPASKTLLSPIATITPAPAKPLQKYSFPNLRNQTFSPLPIELVESIATGSGYTSWLFRYQTDDGWISGQVNLPKFKVQSSKFKADIAIVSPQNPVDMVDFPKLFKKKKIPYIFDPGQQMTSLSPAQLKQAIAGSEVLIGNDYEISVISKRTGWALEKMLKQTKLLVITKGEKGSEIRTGNKVIKIPPAKPKNTSDPTGAGDAYRAGLIYGLLNNWPLEKTGRLAGLISVYTVEKYGTQTHRFSWAELKKRYSVNFKECL